MFVKPGAGDKYIPIVDEAERAMALKKYLDGIAANASACVCSSRLVERKTLQASLLGLVRAPGDLVLLIGGHSLGKSFAMNWLARTCGPVLAAEGATVFNARPPKGPPSPLVLVVDCRGAGGGSFEEMLRHELVRFVAS